MKTDLTALNVTAAEQKVFDKLEGVARKPETITYGEVGDPIGIRPRTVGHFLFTLQSKLNTIKGFPPLNYLVVNKNPRR